MIFQETLFGRTVTPAERLRQHQRSLAKAQRELDRERGKLEQQEKKLIMDIKKSAKQGQMVRFCLSRLSHPAPASFPTQGLHITNIFCCQLCSRKIMPFLECL